MLIHINFDSQLRRLAGSSRISVDVSESASLRQIVQTLAEKSSELLREALLDEGQEIHSSILVFLENDLVAKELPLSLIEGSELTISTLISGG